MKTYRLIITIVLALSLGFPAMTARAAAPEQTGARSASVTLTTPSPNPALIGAEIIFDLTFSVANIDPGVAGAEIYLSYNPALVGPPTVSGVTVAEARPDFFGTANVSLNEVLPAAQCPGGASPCVHLVLAGPAQITKNGVAARFHFIARAEGSACFAILQSKLVDANGFQVDHVKGQDPCTSVRVNASATGVTLRQGVPATPNPGAGSLACSSVTAIGAATYGPVNTDTTGRFTLANMPTGTLTFRTAYPGYLTAEKTGVVVSGTSQTIDVGTANLRGGDVNGDNAINILDIGSIISKFGRAGVAVKSASANCTVTDEPGDINDDGLINISDLAIAAGNWGLIGPTRWP